MKKYLCILFIMIACCSCGSTYYISTINSNDSRLIKMHNGDFVLENDTISITYAFNGYDIPIWISIYNKMDEPLNVDWKKSFLIIDDVATSYSKQGGTFEGISQNSGVVYQPNSTWSYSESVGSMYGNINMPEDVSFIPPRTKVEYEGLSIYDLDYRNIEDEAYKQAKVNDKRDRAKDVKTIDFTIRDTPLLFRSYLTLYKDGNPDKPFVLDQEFYVSNVIKSTTAPDGFSSRLIRRGDISFKAEPYQYRTWHYVVGSVAVLAPVIGVTIWGFSNMDTSIDK